MLSISKMSLAVALAIAIGNNAFADNTVAEDNKNNKAQDNTTTNTDGLKVSTTIVEDDDKIDPEELSIFAAKTVLRMQSDTSKKYLKNSKVADVSTFPMRLVTKLSQDPWQKAPNLPFLAKNECFYGTPSYIIPTHTEREFNARKMQEMGVAKMILPEEITETQIEKDINELLTQASYREKSRMYQNKITQIHPRGEIMIADYVESVIGK